MNWHKINKFSQLKSFQYKIPEDPERLMYDFVDRELNQQKQTLMNTPQVIELQEQKVENQK